MARGRISRSVRLPQHRHERHQPVRPRQGGGQGYVGSVRPCSSCQIGGAIDAWMINGHRVRRRYFVAIGFSVTMARSIFASSLRKVLP
jgi:hypothetical protein